MARSRRRRSERPHGEDSFERLLSGWKRSETRGGREWTVQPVSAQQAVKQYVCPGCGRLIPPATAHIVAWRADGVMGESADLADRRHWHSHCWRMS